MRMLVRLLPLRYYDNVGETPTATLLGECLTDSSGYRLVEYDELLLSYIFKAPGS